MELSGPLVDRNFTDETWRAIFGGDPAIVGDTTGTSYTITLPANTNDAELSAPEHDAMSVVGGFSHRIPRGETHRIEIPPATDATTGRTDVVGVLYDPTVTSDPGPCRVTRIPGVEGSAVVPEYSGTGEFMHLYSIKRLAGQSLNQAVSQDLRRRRGPQLTVGRSTDLPANASLGTRLERGGVEWVRDLSEAKKPTWINMNSGRLLSVLNGAWHTLPPSGLLGATVGVWGAATQNLASVSIPDPGVPYRVQYYLSAFIGTETTASTRFDYDCMLGNTNTVLRVNAGENPVYTTYKHWTTIPSIQVFTGTQVAYFRARRISGNDYGAVHTDGNKAFRVAVWSAS